MLVRLLRDVTRSAHAALQAFRRRRLAATTPAAPRLVTGTLADLLRNKRELVGENALLRQQLVVLNRSVKRPRCTCASRKVHPPPSAPMATPHPRGRTTSASP